MKTVYEPHPVTPERKAELRAQGFKIVDARFAPPAPVEVLELVERVEPVAKRGRPKKAR